MKRFLLTLALVAAGSALAHADLKESHPGAGAVLDTAPQQVVLEFTEPVEIMFSVFKVYRFDADVDLEAENAQLRLNGLAAGVVNQVLELADDGDDRVDLGAFPAAATTSMVALQLVEDLPDGHYVIMWRVLSIDTHVTDGFAVFSVASAE